MRRYLGQSAGERIVTSKNQIISLVVGTMLLCAGHNAVAQENQAKPKEPSTRLPSSPVPLRPAGKSAEEADVPEVENELPQFETGVEFEPMSPRARVTFNLEEAELPDSGSAHLQHDRATLHPAYQAAGGQSHGLRPHQGYRCRGVPGVPVRPRRERVHGRPRRSLPEESSRSRTSSRGRSRSTTTRASFPSPTDTSPASTIWRTSPLKTSPASSVASSPRPGTSLRTARRTC